MRKLKISHADNFAVILFLTYTIKTGPHMLSACDLISTKIRTVLKQLSLLTANSIDMSHYI